MMMAMMMSKKLKNEALPTTERLENVIAVLCGAGC